MTRKVYIPNKGGRNYKPALEYGTLVFLSEGYINKFDTNAQYCSFFQTLKDSHPDDYLMVCGPVVLNVIAASILARLHGKINLLIYRSRENDYLHREILVDNLADSLHNFNEAFDKTSTS